MLFIYIIDKAAPDCSNNRCVALLLRLRLLQTTTKIRCDEAVVNTSSSLCSEGVKPEKSTGTKRGTGFKRKAAFAPKAQYFPGERDGKVFSELRFHGKAWWSVDMLADWIRRTHQEHQEQLQLHARISAVWGLIPTAVFNTWRWVIIYISIRCLCLLGRGIIVAAAGFLFW